MLLNTLQCTVSPTTKKDPVSHVRSGLVGHPVLEIRERDGGQASFGRFLLL